MRVFVVGSGAREHAIVWKLLQSPQVDEVLVSPGNAGTAQIARNLDLPASNIGALAQAAQREGADLTVVGPEAPLASGIVDHFQSLGLAIFGPSKAAAQIEASKVFAKDLMLRHGIPCAASRSFDSFSQALAYLEDHSPPVVVKADGLAAGKGVTVAQDREEAEYALVELMERGAHGEAGKRVVIEERLSGQEVSVLAFTDGKTVLPMVPACDYKRLYNADLGPNTGGMGCYSPPSFVDKVMVAQIKETILEPTVRALAEEGIRYRGVLYGGLIVTEEGPKVLEFNCRFGDPETQVILPRLKSDLLPLLQATMEGTLDRVEPQWDEGACVGVVVASGGYPGSYQTGFPIQGWDCLDEDILVFHAGTRLDDAGRVVSAGGRVLTVVGRGRTLAEARARAYLNVPCLQFQGRHFRTDIAEREVR